MFGFPNVRGSCWVNTCLQCIFRIPELQKRYTDEHADTTNPIDMSLQTIWRSKGKDGLSVFFETVHSKLMPAGKGIGDTHELFQSLCDKLPFVDELVRFKIADSIQCANCSHKEIREDSVTEFSVTSTSPNMSLTECIADAVKPQTIDTWKCETCGKQGCTKQQLIGSFPKLMVFHALPSKHSIAYASVLALNQRDYALCAVACYNGGHWWAYGRDMPVGSSWYTLNDQHVQNHGAKQFPMSNQMRVLIYYRLD